MHLRPLIFASLLLVGSVALGVAAHVFGQQRRSDAAWLLTRASADASAYSESFDGRHIDAELGTLGERRAMLEVAGRYDMLRALGGLGAGASLVWFYVLFLMSRVKPVGGAPIITAKERELAAGVAPAAAG